MARRRHRQSRRTGLAWPILAFGGILLVLAVFLFANRSGGADAGGGSPQIAVEPQKIDYGYVKYGNTESFRLKVTNNGDGVMRFKEQPYIEVLEGC